MSDLSRALVVDDEPVARRTVKFALEQEGFLCETAIDGIDALQHLRENDYALVVTDLRMPKKHGHALSVELLRMNPRPVIVVHSCLDDPRLTKDLILRGVDDIVYKPTNYAAFEAKMRAYVSRRAVTPSRPLPAVQAVAQEEDKENAEPSSTEQDSQRNDQHELAPELKSSVSSDSPVPLSDIESRLSLVLRILPVSKAALDVFEMTRAGCDAPKLGEAICRDAALAAEVLSIANSNFYNPSGKAVTELDQAVVRIGQRRTGELALAASTLTSLTTRKFSWMDMRTTWRQSIAAGVAVEILVASGKHGAIGENLALVAIMHSLGRVVLGTLYPDHYQRLIKQCEEKQDALIEQEMHVFPESHARIMTRLLSEWNIPEQISKPMNYILDPYHSLSQLSQQMRTKVELIKLAVFLGQLATRAWHSWDLVEIPSASLLKRLNIHDIGSILEQTRTNTQSIIDFQSSTSKDQQKDSEPQKPAEISRKICYHRVTSPPFDFVRQLISDSGIGMDPVPNGGPASGSGVVLNLLERSQDEAVPEFSLPDGARQLVVTDRPQSELPEGQTLVLPFSYGKLQSALAAVSSA